MFVLRSKVQLSEGGDQVWGLVGEAARQALGDAAQGLTWSRQPHAGGQLVRLPDVQGVSRWLWLGPADAAAWLSSLPALSGDAWACLEVLSGIPRVTVPTFDQFVPQMVNFELVGGVNFRKGCYPGQEIVARSQYLGKLKRRMLLASVDTDELAAVMPGTEVFSDDDPGQPGGMIVNAERGPDGRIACLVEIKIDAVGSPVHLGSANGPLLQFGELPYALEASA